MSLCCLLQKITNFIEHNPAWKADRLPNNEEISCLLRKPKCYYCLPLVYIMTTWLNAVPIVIPNSLTFHVNIMLYSIPIFSSDLSLSHFCAEVLYAFFFIFSMYRKLYPLWFQTQNADGNYMNTMASLVYEHLVSQKINYAC